MPAGAKATIYNLNGSAGAFTDIPCTRWCRRMEIIEDDSNAANQGLDAKFSDDNYVQSFRFSFGVQPITVGDPIPQGNAKGHMIGGPANNSGGGSKTADVPVKLRSATATATVVRVVEYD
jgi:hypothetical protein